VNQTVRLPRCRKAASYSAQFVTRLGNMMTTRGVMLERHGRQLPVINGASAYANQALPATRPGPCNNVMLARFEIGIGGRLRRNPQSALVKLSYSMVTSARLLTNREHGRSCPEFCPTYLQLFRSGHATC
jgi:hypothetical protein